MIEGVRAPAIQAGLIAADEFDAGNRIETLLRLVKHRWLSPAAYTTFATLRESVFSILDLVSLNYRVTFS